MGAGFILAGRGFFAEVGRFIWADDRPADWQKAEGKSRVASLFLLICKALPTALGVATAALAALGELDTRSGFALLGLGLACVGIVLLSSEKQ